MEIIIFSKQVDNKTLKTLLENEANRAKSNITFQLRETNLTFRAGDETYILIAININTTDILFLVLMIYTMLKIYEKILIYSNDRVREVLYGTPPEIIHELFSLTNIHTLNVERIEIAETFMEILFELSSQNTPIDQQGIINFFQNKFNVEATVLDFNLSKRYLRLKVCKGDKHILLKNIESSSLIKELIPFKINSVQEVIDENNECIFQYIPEVSFNNPKIIDVNVNKLQSVIAKVQILLLTVNDWERKALLSEMSPLGGEEGILQGALSTITYRVGMFGNYCAAYTESTMGSGGRQGAALTTERAINELKPKAVFLLGIAFGIDRGYQRLGDLLIAESIFPYEYQKINDSFTIHRGQSVPCGSILSERFRTRRIDWEIFCGQRKVKVYQNLVLSGGKVVNNKLFRDILVKEFPTAIGGEMEGEGAYAAVSPPNEVILIKSICDWADGDKNDNAQPFAAFTAISLAKHVLSKPDVLHPLVANNCDAQLIVNDISASLTTKPKITSDNISNPNKYSEKLIDLLKQKFDSLTNKPPRLLLLELKELLHFIRNNEVINIITSKMESQLLKKYSLTKELFEKEKDIAIEIKNKLVDKYSKIDDSNKEFSHPIDDSLDFLSSFNRFNSLTNIAIKVPFYDLEDKPGQDDSQISDLLEIIKIKLNDCKDQQNVLSKEVGEEIYQVSYLEKEHKYNNQEWFNFCQISPEVSLFRLHKIVSKINPMPEDDSEFRKLPSQEKLKWAFEHVGEHMFYSWINSLVEGKTSENDRKVLFKIENIKRDLKRLYEKILEEMILANHSKINVTENMPTIEPPQKTNNASLEKHMPKNKIAQLSNLQFVKSVEKNLDRNEVKLVWFELFNSNMDDELSRHSLMDCIMELRIRAEKRGFLDKLYETLVHLRPTLENLF